MRETALAHSMYGQPYVTSERAEPHSAGRDVVRAMYDGVPYEGHTACRANNDTCRAPRKTGFDFCVGHQRAYEKHLKESAENGSS